MVKKGFYYMKKPINMFNAFVEDKDKDQKLIKKLKNMH